jgi:hypothetical protein
MHVFRWLRVPLLYPVFSAAIIITSPAVYGQAIFAQTGGQPRTDGGKVVGITLTSFGQTISSLGVYDSGDGLSTSYTVGLWDSGQNLVASTVVTPGSPLVGDFRYENITPVTIGTFVSPQSFTIGVLLPGTMPDIWLDQATLTLGAGYAGFGTGQYTTSGSLVFPATVDTGNAYYVVNAGGPVQVPEPGMLGLLGAGLAVVLVMRCKRTSVAQRVSGSGSR